MTPESSYKANPDVSCRDEGEDGGLLFNPDTNDSVLINPTGLGLWALLELPRTVAQLTTRLVEEFGAPTLEQAANDVDEFIKGLLPDFILEVE